MAGNITLHQVLSGVPLSQWKSSGIGLINVLKQSHGLQWQNIMQANPAVNVSRDTGAANMNCPSAIF